MLLGKIRRLEREPDTDSQAKKRMPSFVKVKSKEDLFDEKKDCGRFHPVLGSRLPVATSARDLLGAPGAGNQEGQNRRSPPAILIRH